MGYKVLYPALRKQRFPKRKISDRTRLRIIAAICSGFILVILLWQVGLSWLLPGDPVVTENALQAMVDRLRAGESLGDAVVTFCREVVEGAR